MKIIGTIIKTLIKMIFVAFCTLAIAFLLTIVMPDNVLKAIEIIRSLL